MSPSSPSIVWFRQDLRTADNPALTAAADTGSPVLPIFILDDENAGEWKKGAASRWWLHRSLHALNQSLNGKLRFFKGPAEDVICNLASELGAKRIYWNRCYEPWRSKRDRIILKRLRDAGHEARSYNGSLLFEPQSITKQDGAPYKVFTPYYRRGCLAAENAPRAVLPEVRKLNYHAAQVGMTLDNLALLPDVNWYEDLDRTWTPGENGAAARLRQFLHGGIQDYKEGRNRPDQEFVSRLSPHLHFGELSPHQAWHKVRAMPENDNTDHFLSELGWREFSHYLLYHWPDMPRNSLQKRFDRLPWRHDRSDLERWQQGQTGIPIVDAGMRQLWRTGYMHNRVRMLVGSFLVKNLLIHWHHGEDWFWDTLVDADLANNSAGWQWIAGCGADAAPYFRVFNPVLQGKKFDPDGHYVRRYVPELSRMPSRFIHNPWEAPAESLDKANVTLGEDYPRPMVDLKKSRELALEAFGVTKADSERT